MLQMLLVELILQCKLTTFTCVSLLFTFKQKYTTKNIAILNRIFMFKVSNKHTHVNVVSLHCMIR